MGDFDVIVVGAGMMGSAAARHLAKAGASVALIGPGEPRSKRAHEGVFASHYDAARITRALDADATWSKLSMSAIARYAEVESEGKRTFFNPVGSLIVAQQKHEAAADFLRRVRAVGERHGIDYETLRGDALRTRFPFFAFPDGVVALHERLNAGYIDPRAHVTAQKAAAVSAGAVLIEAEATGIAEESDAVTVACANGEVFRAGKVIAACGGFSISGGVLPEPLPLRVYARTVLFCELDRSESERLRAMPSLIYRPAADRDGVYVLPPVTYPDGKTYIKIGGDPQDLILETVDDIKAWFRTDGNAAVGDHLHDRLQGFMPGLRSRTLSTGSCVTAFTDTGKPLIQCRSKRIVVVAGGNGAGAKCADEIGRLGAEVAAGRSIASQGYAVDFGNLDRTHQPNR